MRVRAVVSLAIALAFCGRARAQAGTELRCSLAIRPVVVDASGARVPASPDRFELRARGGEAEIHAERGEWTVRASALRFEYELVDRRSGAVVVHETASLSCGREPAPVTPTPLIPGRVIDGDTRGAAHLVGARCGGEGRARWHVLHLDRARRVLLRLASSFDASLVLRASGIDGPELACRDESERFETLDLNLPAGTYLVAVGARDTGGHYRLQAFAHPPDPNALSDAPRGQLVPGSDVEGVIAPGASHHGGRCGGQQAPEHVYRLHVDWPTQVALHLESRFDAAVYLRSAGGDEIDCGVVLGYPDEVRLSRASARLGPGDYVVVVDGAGRRTGTGWYRLGVDFIR